jgi:superfamily I DNA and/or RNA helicase
MSVCEAEFVARLFGEAGPLAGVPPSRVVVITFYRAQVCVCAERAQARARARVLMFLGMKVDAMKERLRRDAAAVEVHTVDSFQARPPSVC